MAGYGCRSVVHGHREFRGAGLEMGWHRGRWLAVERCRACDVSGSDCCWSRAATRVLQEEVGSILCVHGCWTGACGDHAECDQGQLWARWAVGYSPTVCRDGSDRSAGGFPVSEFKQFLGVVVIEELDLL